MAAVSGCGELTLAHFGPDRVGTALRGRQVLLAVGGATIARQFLGWPCLPTPTPPAVITASTAHAPPPRQPMPQARTRCRPVAPRSLALQQNQVPLLRSMAIDHSGKAPHTDLMRRVTATPALFAPYECRIESIPCDATYRIGSLALQLCSLTDLQDHCSQPAKAGFLIASPGFQPWVAPIRWRCTCVRVNRRRFAGRLDRAAARRYHNYPVRPRHCPSIDADCRGPAASPALAWTAGPSGVAGGLCAPRYGGIAPHRR